MKIPTLLQRPHLTNGLSAIFAGKQTSIRTIMLLALLASIQPAATASTNYTWNVSSGNWSATNSWTPFSNVGGPTANDSVVFGAVGTVSSPTTVNNTVDAGFGGVITNFTCNNSALSPFVYDVTQIPAGMTLDVVGNFLVGGINEVNTAAATEAYIVGGGTLLVTATNMAVENYDNTTRSGANAFLNLAGLTNFIYRNTAGTIRAEDRVPGDNTDTGLGGSITLATVSNNITASALNLGTSTAAQIGPAGTLLLGAGTNIINASSINVAAQKCTFTIANTGGGLRIRGLTGADSDSSDNITLGNRNVGSSTGSIMGNMLLNGCAVDIKAGTLIVGENSGGAPSSLADGGNGVLQFDTGTVSANSVIMADNTSSNNVSNGMQAQCSGLIDVGSKGTLLIGAGQLFDLASETGNGPSSGTLIISNGLVNCQGPIAMGPNVGGTSSGSIVFLTGGTLNMGPNSYVGTLAAPITTLTLTNNTLSVSIPSISYTNICVITNNWPTPDSGLTISVAAMPAGILPGAVFPFLNCSTFNGTFTSPKLSLPPGVEGYLSLVNGTNMYLTITAGVGPGTGGVQQLTNASFEAPPAGTGWTTTGGASVVTTNVNTTYPNSGGCTVDTRPIQILAGTNVAKLTGSFVAGGSTNFWSQSVPTVPGYSFTAGAFTYVAHEDMLSGADSFYLEVDFKDISGNLLSSYESLVVTNMTCGGPNIIPLDTWASMPITNEMQVTGGHNTGVIISNITSSIFIAPPQAATATYNAVFIQRNATDSGSVYFDAANLGFLGYPVAPTISVVTPNLVAFCTNTTLSCTASSTETTISSFQVIAQTTTLGGTITNNVTNTVSPTYITGLGTASATISYPLTTNTIYLSVIVKATDADGLTVSSTAVNFDTLVPILVVEASDYNYSSGGFMDTPSDGGVALYTNQVGTAGTDYQKAARTAAPAYYRLGDPVIMQTAVPSSGVPPTSTEQKYISAAADGDTSTNDVELEVGYNTPGDWLNYSRTFGPGGSAPAGTYNVWCYLATSGSGPQLSFSQVTAGSMTSTQTTNYLGNFGTAAFTDGSYNSFQYVPLVDQFGNRISLTISNGVQTFKSTVLGNPNIGFYLFVPVAPILTPVFQNISPNGTGPYESAGNFTFTVGPANGTPISTNGIGLVVNGQTVTSGLAFTPVGSSWTVNYGIASNELYTITVNVTNLAGLFTTTTTSFDTFSIDNYMWEAVDYDYSTNNGTGWVSGLFIDNPVPTGNLTSPITGTFATNSYYGYPTGFTPGVDPYGLGALAQQGIDMNFTNLQSSTNAAYRADGVGSQVATDYLRPKFLAAQTNFGDPTICMFNIGYFDSGNWLNYTRTYPTNFYNVWGRLAGGGGPFSGTTLGMVTNGVGTPNQMVNVLGSFADPNAAGWQTYHWIPLLDTNGNQVVVYLGGQATLRVTSGNNLNVLCFMLAPAAEPEPSFAIGASVSGGNIQISIPTLPGHSYTLFTSGSLAGGWTQVGGALSGDGSSQVVSQPLSGSQGFYRVIVQ